MHRQQPDSHRSFVTEVSRWLTALLPLVARGVTASASIVGTLLFAHHYPADALGPFFVAQAIVWLVAQVARLGLDHQMMVRNVRRLNVRSIYNGLELLVFMAVAAVAGTACAVVIVLGFPALAILYDPVVAEYTFTMAIAVPALTCLLLVSMWLRSEMRPHVSVFFESGGINVAMVVLFLFWQPPLPFLFLASSSCVVLVAVALIMPRVHHVVRSRRGRNDLKRMLRQTRCRWRFASLNILFFLGPNMSMLIGGAIFPADEIARLRVAERLGSAVGFPAIVQNSVVPAKVARAMVATDAHKPSGPRQQTLIYTSLSLCIAVAIGLGHAAGWMSVSASSSYDGWINSWLVYAIGYVAAVVIGPAEGTAAALGYARELNRTVAIWILVFAAVTIGLAHLLGEVAAAAGFSAYLVGMRLSMMRVIRRRLDAGP